MESPSSAEERPDKRARTDEPDLERTVVRSADLWLDDGNIVLRPQGSQQNGTVTLYKVHKSTLALHCTAFKDLFDVPQTTFDIASEKYDGVPVMDMHDDPKDVQDFLKALYFPLFTRCRPWIDGLPSSFPGVYAGILRLATKYDAQDIRQFIVDAITAAWPTKLREWNRRQQEAERERWDCPVELRETVNVYTECYPDPAQTIRLATDHGIPDVLPIAYYDLLRVFEKQGPAYQGHRRADLTLLTPGELRRVIVGRGLLNACVQNSCSKPRRSGYDVCECKNGYQCMILVDRGWSKRVHSLRENPFGRVDDSDMQP